MEETATTISQNVSKILIEAVELFRIIDQHNHGPFNINTFADELPSLIKATHTESIYDADSSDHIIKFSQNNHYVELDKSLWEGIVLTQEADDFETVLDFFNVGLKNFKRFTGAYPEFEDFVENYANIPVESERLSEEEELELHLKLDGVLADMIYCHGREESIPDLVDDGAPNDAMNVIIRELNDCVEEIEFFPITEPVLPDGQELYVAQDFIDYRDEDNNLPAPGLEVTCLMDQLKGIESNVIAADTEYETFSIIL